VLTSDHLADENSLDAPTKISPHSSPITVRSPVFNQSIPAHAVMVLRVGLSLFCAVPAASRSVDMGNRFALCPKSR